MKIPTATSRCARGVMESTIRRRIWMKRWRVRWRRRL